MELNYTLSILITQNIGTGKLLRNQYKIRNFRLNIKH